jgi:hypothetical protein
MKLARDATQQEDRHEVTLPGGCILCSGDLIVRFTAAGAASFCPTCRWISHPQVRREDGGVYMAHPAGGIA